MLSSTLDSCAPSIDGLTDFLSTLKQKKLILGVATMDSEKSAVHTLKKLEILHFFDFVCGADSGHGVKPDAGMLWAFSLDTGIDSSKIMMVGDTTRDIFMGKNAKAGLSIGVLTGSSSRTDLERDADAVFPDITGILTLL